MKTNKPNIVRVERDTWATMNGQFYKIFYDRPMADEYVTNKDGEHYTYLLADDELQAWTATQKMLDVQYGKD